jgi:hypothetical protein
MVVQKTRAKAGEYFLQRVIPSPGRMVTVCPWDQAQTIGILFDATQPEELKMVQQIVRRLRDEKKKVRAMGFYNAKESPNMLNAKLEFDYFTRKQVNWHYRPRDPILQTYLEEPFDVLINLCSRPLLPLLYMVALSNARFKVGRFHARFLRFYDFCLTTQEAVSPKVLFDHAEHYLRVLKPIS